MILCFELRLRAFISGYMSPPEIHTTPLNHRNPTKKYNLIIIYQYKARLLYQGMMKVDVGRIQTYHSMIMYRTTLIVVDSHNAPWNRIFCKNRLARKPQQ